MVYRLVGDRGEVVDAHFDLEDGAVIFHARGGARSNPNALNTEYGTGLRLLLERIITAKLRVVGAWVDSSRVQRLPLSDREILSEQDFSNDPQDLYTKLTTRMAQVGRSPSAKPGGGNMTKRIKIQFSDSPSVERLQSALGGVQVIAGTRQTGRMPASELRKVEADHIWRAVRSLAANPSETPFSDPTGYEVVLDDGTRLAPKAVFGLALTEALNEEVLPEHFSGGETSICNQAIRNAGFPIVAKGEAPAKLPEDVEPEDRGWAEGAAVLVTHKRRERASGLSRAKKAAFVREHGRLFCERCGLVPNEKYPVAVADACIEVHHANTHVGDMGDEHITQLDDLQCLCANCHRITHRELRSEQSG